MAFTFKKNTNIGNLEAETDVFLDNCFLETEAYKTLLEFNRSTEFFKRIIVGRTGSGKTALLKRLDEADELYSNEKIEAEKTIFEYVRNNIFISELINQNIDLRIFFKALWVHVILVKIIEILTDKNSFLENLLLKNRKDLEDYITSYNGTFFEDEALTVITQRFAENVDSELKAGFAKVGAEIQNGEEKRTQSITNNYVSKELLVKQQKIINFLEKEYVSNNRQKKIIINIDDLDKNWLLSRNIKYDFINALLDAFKEFLNIELVKVIVSIRTDILEGVYLNNLRQDEKDKSSIMPIEWTSKEIISLINKRLECLLEDHYQKKQIPTFDKIFDFKVNNENATDYIINRTMLRPRDAIEFVNLCFSSAEGNSVIVEKNVIEAEESYFTSRKNALIKEWSSIYNEVKTYIDLIHIINAKNFHMGKLIAIFPKIKDSLLHTDNAEDNLVQLVIKLSEHEEYEEKIIKELLNIWFTIGLIGIVKNEDIIVYSKFEKQHLDLSDYNKEFCIHPLFWRNN